MTHFEIQHIKTLSSHMKANVEDVAANFDDTCLSCDEPVGLNQGEFHEYVIVTDENGDYWFVCEQCSLPVIEPNSIRKNEMTSMRTSSYKLRHALGEIIKKTRVEQQRTLRDVATKASISLGYLCEIEQGQKEASSEILECIAYSLNVPVYRLVVEAGYHLGDFYGEFSAEQLLVDALV